MESSLDFLMGLQWALKVCRLYGEEHPRNQEVLTGLEGSYQRFLAGKGQIQIATRNGRMFVDRVMEDAQNLQTKALAKELEERDIHALILYPGATREELQAVIAVLCLKPSQLREQGGAKQFLERKSVSRIRILAARLEDVSEAGEITAALLESMAGLPLGISGTGGPGRTPVPAVVKPPGGRAPAIAPDDHGALVGWLRGQFLALAGAGSASPDLSGLGAMLQSMGMDSQGVQPGTQGVVRQALATLAPEQQVEVLRGAAGLRSGSLRNLFGRLSSTMAASSLATSYAHGFLPAAKLAECAQQLKPLNPNPEQWGEQLVDALRREGMSEGQLRELVDILNWDAQPLPTKLAKLLEGQRIFEMPVEKVLAFLRELLEAGRGQEFLRVMRHFAGGLVAPAVARRTTVAKAFEKIADWADIPGMPTNLLNELMDQLSGNYGREKDPEVHQWLSQAVEHILWHWVESGDPGMAHALFMELQDVVTELSLPAPWKSQATAELLARLGAPDRMNKVLTQLFIMDRQVASIRIHPYLKMLGASAAVHLVERLADEPDRTRRAYLLEALKACGAAAEAPLLESLKADEWFVVRNALIVLAEIAGPDRVQQLVPLLSHPDSRVVGATIRALGRIGGRPAEAALINLLAHRDPAIQLELLFVLGELKARQAVPALIELVKGGKSRPRPEQERVREKAVELLGLLEAPSVIPVLEDLLRRRKGFFRETKEPLAVRLACLRALVGLESGEAQEVLRKVLAEEPKGDERDALNAALTECLLQHPLKG